MVVMAYKTQDKIAEYGFSIEFLPDAGWRIYIVFRPCLRCEAHRQSHLPYQSIDHNGRRYVDWSAKIESLGEARLVAELWAELTRDCQHIEAHTPNNDAAAEETGAVQQPRTDAA